MKVKAGENPTLKHKLVWFFEILSLYVFKVAIYFFPYNAKLKIGKKIGALIFRLDRKHRDVCLSNLKSAFPEKNQEEIKSIAKKSFENIGRLFIEIIFMKTFYRKIFTKSKIYGWENLQELIMKKSGYFLVSGHFGNWEFVAFQQSKLGYPLEMVTRPLDNPYLEKYFKKIRESAGNRVVYKRNAVREMAKAIKNKEGVAFVFDQNFGEEGAVFVPFFNRPAATTPALGRIAVRLKAPILPVFAVPEEYGYKISYGKPIYPDLSKEADVAAFKLIEEATSLLEQKIRETPSAWFWMHDRWRTKPEDFSK
ncbi:MAG: lysophospholipid acyltransferase family protein, partial [Acidobacteria bacterium]|nr:lysophospholipid acyltransferase family protein [Acidobacteriota bacterium]